MLRITTTLCLHLQGKDRPYWIQSLEAGKGMKNSIGFTTVGKPKMAQKQFNSPLEMYSEDALEEIMKEGTLGYEDRLHNLADLHYLQ